MPLTNKDTTQVDAVCRQLVTAATQTHANDLLRYRDARAKLFPADGSLSPAVMMGGFGPNGGEVLRYFQSQQDHLNAVADLFGGDKDRVAPFLPAGFTAAANADGSVTLTPPPPPAPPAALPQPPAAPAVAAKALPPAPDAKPGA